MWGQPAGERFWKLRVETHTYNTPPTPPLPTPRRSILLYVHLLTAHPSSDITGARCKRLRKLVALLLPSAWLMWFYHRRTSVCLAPPLEEAYCDDPDVIFVGLAPLGPPSSCRKPVVTNAALDYGLGWRSFVAAALREVSLTTFMYLCTLYRMVKKLFGDFSIGRNDTILGIIIF